MDYFNQLLESYNLLKKRQLKIKATLSEQEGAVQDTGAEGKASAALAQVPEPSNQKTGTVIGKNKSGGEVVVWKGQGKKVFMLGTKGQNIITVGDESRGPGPDYGKLVAFFKGKEEGGEEGEDSTTIEHDGISNEEKIKNDLDALDPEIYANLQRLCAQLSNNLIQGKFAGDYPFTKPDPISGEPSMPEFETHCISNSPGSLSRSIIDVLDPAKNSSLIKSLLDGDVVKESPLLQQDPLGAQKIAQALGTLNRVANIASKDTIDDGDIEFLRGSLRVEKKGERVRVFVKSLDDDHGISFDKKGTSPVGAMMSELAAKLEENGTPLPVQQITPNATSNAANLNEVKKESSEELFIIIGDFMTGDRDKAVEAFTTLIDSFGSVIEASWALDKFYDEQGLSTEDTEQLREWVEDIDRITQADTADEASKRLLGKGLQIFHKYISQCSSKDPKQNLIESRIRVGGKTGKEEKADILEMTTNRDNLNNCLKAQGLSNKKDRDEKIEERSLRELLEEDVLTKGETVEEKIKEMKEAGQIPEEWDEDQKVYTHRLDLKVYMNDKRPRKIGESPVRGALKSLVANTKYGRQVMKALGIPDTPKGEPNPERDAYISEAQKLSDDVDALNNTLSEALGDAGLAFDFGGMSVAQLKTTVLDVVSTHFKSNATFKSLVNDKMIQDVINQAKKQGEKGEGKKKASGLEILSSHLTGEYVQSFVGDRMDERKGGNLTSGARAARQVMAGIAIQTGGSAKSTDTLDATLETGESHLFDSQRFFKDTLTPFINGETGLEQKGKTSTFAPDKNGKCLQVGMSRSKSGETFEVKIKNCGKQSRESWEEKNINDSVESLARNYFITQQKLFEVLELN